MALNKDTVSRQRFWFCLGGFVLIWFIGFITVKVSAGSKIAKAKGDYEKADKDLETAKRGDPKNETFTKPFLDAAAVYTKHVDVVHKDAWVLQMDLFTFPNSARAPLQTMWTTSDTFPDWYKKFTENRDKGGILNDYGDKLYKQQFAEFYKKIGGPDEKKLNLGHMLSPVEFKGGEGGFKTMMTPTVGTATGGAMGPPVKGGRPADPGRGMNDAANGRDIDKFFERPPTIEELWYAQEDFWVKSEMLYAVRRTLDAAGKFSREESGMWATLGHLAEHPDRQFTPYVKPDRKPEKGTDYIAEYRFRNSSWEMHLLFEEGASGKFFVSANSTIRNVHSSKRVQAGSRLPPKGQTKKLPMKFLLKQKLDGVPEQFELAVEVEDLAWNQFARFKSSEFINTGFDPRKPFAVEQIFDWYTAPIRRIDDIKTCVNSHRTSHIQLKPHTTLSKAPEEKGPDGAPVAAAPTPPPAANPMAAAAGPVGPQPTENNGLERNRYLNTTATCRDLPFAIVVVVEQPHLHDFLVQLANSQLRIQITQIHFNRVRNVAPALEDAAPGTQPNPRTQPMGGQGQMQDADPNLVEVTIYGIAALYEKFDMKKLEPAKTEAKP